MQRSKCQPDVSRHIQCYHRILHDSTFWTCIGSQTHEFPCRLWTLKSQQEQADCAPNPSHEKRNFEAPKRSATAIRLDTPAKADTGKLCGPHRHYAKELRCVNQLIAMSMLPNCNPSGEVKRSAIPETSEWHFAKIDQPDECQGLVKQLSRKAHKLRSKIPGCTFMSLTIFWSARSKIWLAWTHRGRSRACIVERELGLRFPFYAETHHTSTDCVHDQGVWCDDCACPSMLRIHWKVRGIGVCHVGGSSL